MNEQPMIHEQRVLAYRNDADIFLDYINLNVIGLQGSIAGEGGQKRFRGVLSFEPFGDAYGSNPATGIRLTNDGATELMTRLWTLGIRPRDIGTTGHLAATQAHLADFRAIVAKQLGIEMK